MEKNEVIALKKFKLFNSPIEIGIRSLVILVELSPQKIDFQKLVYLDYILLNSGEIDQGPESLHPKIPTRSTAIGLRRKDLNDGLDLLVSKDLVKKEFSPDLGILYSANDLSDRFLKHFESQYYKELVSRAKWINQKFKNFDSQKLAELVESKLGDWEVEFTKDSNSRSDWHNK